jgi:hypothetical protein
MFSAVVESSGRGAAARSSGAHFSARPGWAKVFTDTLPPNLKQPEGESDRRAALAYGLLISRHSDADPLGHGRVERRADHVLYWLSNLALSSLMRRISGSGRLTAMRFAFSRFGISSSLLKATVRGVRCTHEYFSNFFEDALAPPALLLTPLISLTVSAEKREFFNVSGLFR